MFIGQDAWMLEVGRNLDLDLEARDLGDFLISISISSRNVLTSKIEIFKTHFLIDNCEIFWDDYKKYQKYL